MTDIVKELRDPELCTHYAAGSCVTRACMERVIGSTRVRWRFVGCLNYRAAEEIERLRAGHKSGAALHNTEGE